MPMYRSEALRRLATETFDILIIGGGITGAGIAQDAAHRGLRTALVEKGDFASGTSQASTKLLHGGVRYLEQAQFKLMYEALHERNRLTRLAPHVAEWLQFLIPIYGRGWKMERIGAGLWMYDMLAGFPKGRLHRRISAAEALEIAPTLSPEGLRGAYLYYDGRTDDTRLTMDVLASAAEGGAAAANYCKVVALAKTEGKVGGAVVSDELTGNSFTVKAACVVNATGPWSDWVNELDEPGAERKLAPSKGVHLVVPSSRLPVRGAVLAPSPSGDGRFIFVVPWQGATLLGTTDTPFSDHPDMVATTEADIAYILAAANTAFPRANLERRDVISAIVGLRPLIKATADTTAALPREHKLWVSDSGMISIAGGKLTTYRTMAAEVTDLAMRRLGRKAVPCRTGDIPLGVQRARGVAEFIRQSPELGHPVVPGLPHTLAEVAYAAREEMAVFPEDIFHRRTRIALLDREHGERHTAEVQALLERFGEGAAVRADGGRPEKGEPVAGAN